jgi:hypothetical protein
MPPLFFHASEPPGAGLLAGLHWAPSRRLQWLGHSGTTPAREVSGMDRRFVDLAKSLRASSKVRLVLKLSESVWTEKRRSGYVRDQWQLR